MKQSAISILFDDRTVHHQRSIISSWAQSNGVELIEETAPLQMTKNGTRHVRLPRAIAKAAANGAMLVHTGFPAKAWRLMMKWVQLGNPPSVVVADTNAKPRTLWTRSPDIGRPIIATGNLFEDVRHVLPVERLVWTKAALERARREAMGARRPDQLDKRARQRLEELNKTQLGELEGLEAWRGLPVPALPVRIDDDAPIRIPLAFARHHAEIAARLPPKMTRHQLILGDKPRREWRQGRYWRPTDHVDIDWQDLSDAICLHLGRDPRTGEPL